MIIIHIIRFNPNQGELCLVFVQKAQKIYVLCYVSSLIII